MCASVCARVDKLMHADLNDGDSGVLGILWRAGFVWAMVVMYLLNSELGKCLRMSR